MKKLLMITVILCVSACGNMNTTQAQKEQEAISYKIKVATENANKCNKEIEEDVNIKKFYEELFYKDENSPNKMSLMLKNEKVTSEQIEIIKKIGPINYPCRQVVINALNNTPYLPVVLRYYETMDKVYLALAKLELTISEANEAKVKANSQQKADWANISAELDNRLRSNHNAELENRRQQAAIMMPLLMQQQQNQQLLYQQQMQNININRPVTTNCNTYGSQTNCVSR
jgi:hypothetical protein